MDRLFEAERGWAASLTFTHCTYRRPIAPNGGPLPQTNTDTAVPVYSQEGTAAVPMACIIGLCRASGCPLLLQAFRALSETLTHHCNDLSIGVYSVPLAFDRSMEMLLVRAVDVVQSLGSPR